MRAVTTKVSSPQPTTKFKSTFQIDTSWLYKGFMQTMVAEKKKPYSNAYLRHLADHTNEWDLDVTTAMMDMIVYGLSIDDAVFSMKLQLQKDAVIDQQGRYRSFVDIRPAVVHQLCIGNPGKEWGKIVSGFGGAMRVDDTNLNNDVHATPNVYYICLGMLMEVHQKRLQVLYKENRISKEKVDKLINEEGSEWINMDMNEVKHEIRKKILAAIASPTMANNSTYLTIIHLSMAVVEDIVSLRTHLEIIREIKRGLHGKHTILIFYDKAHTHLHGGSPIFKKAMSTVPPTSVAPYENAFDESIMEGLEAYDMSDEAVRNFMKLVGQEAIWPVIISHMSRLRFVKSINTAVNETMTPVNLANLMGIEMDDSTDISALILADPELSELTYPSSLAKNIYQKHLVPFFAFDYLFDKRSKEGKCRDSQQLALEMTKMRLGVAIRRLEDIFISLSNRYRIGKIHMHATVIHNKKEERGYDEMPEGTERQFNRAIEKEIFLLNRRLEVSFGPDFITCHTNLSEGSNRYRAIKPLSAGKRKRKTPEPVDLTIGLTPSTSQYIMDSKTGIPPSKPVGEEIRWMINKSREERVRVMALAQRDTAYNQAMALGGSTFDKMDARLVSKSIPACILIESWKDYKYRYGEMKSSSGLMMAHGVFYIGDLTDHSRIFSTNGHLDELASVVANPPEAIKRAEKIELLRKEYNRLREQTIDYLNVKKDTYQLVADEQDKQLREMLVVAEEISHTQMPYGDPARYQQRKDTDKVQMKAPGTTDTDGDFSPFFEDATWKISNLVHSQHGRSPYIYPFLSNTGTKTDEPPTAIMYLLELYNMYQGWHRTSPCDYIYTHKKLLSHLDKKGCPSQSMIAVKRREHIENLINRRTDFIKYLKILNPSHDTKENPVYMMSDQEKYQADDLFQYIMPFANDALLQDESHASCSLSRLYIRFCLLHNLIHCF